MPKKFSATDKFAMKVALKLKVPASKIARNMKCAVSTVYRLTSENDDRRTNR